MRVHSYVIDHDLGFAPNPFHRVCTLSACKPLIRQHASVGDFVVGTGSIPNGIKDRVVYWMRVDEILTFNRYWDDARFGAKRPVMSGSRMQIYGDNIYRRSADGTFVQADSFHSEPGGVTSLPNLVRDTGRTDRVLLGREYAYWGGSGPLVPQELSDLVHSTQGHRNQFTPERVSAFVTWLRGMPGRGLLGRPANWPA